MAGLWIQTIGFSATLAAASQRLLVSTKIRIPTLSENASSGLQTMDDADLDTDKDALLFYDLSGLLAYRPNSTNVTNCFKRPSATRSEARLLLQFDLSVT